MTDYFQSVEKLKAIYQEDDYILTSSHGPVHYEKQDSMFDELKEKMMATNQNIKNYLDKDHPKKLEDLAFQGLFYPKKSMDRLDEHQKKLYYFWEGWALLHQLDILKQNNSIKEVHKDTWVLNS